MRLEQVGFSYAMPGFQDLYIMRKCQCDADDEDHDHKHDDIECDEDVDGISYELHWNGKICPISFNTQLQALGAALAAQWAIK